MKNVVIILCNPAHSGNIGAVCRAMANTDCAQLRIVGNAQDYDESVIKTMAIHAYDIWERAQFYSPDIAGLQAACSDCSIVAATTRRMGRKRKIWAMTPEQFAHFSQQHTNGKIGIVFGSERAGLTEGQMLCCSTAVQIPASKVNGSLNLSHAVHIMCYVLFRVKSTRSYGYEPISVDEVARLAKDINNDLAAIGLYKKEQGFAENEEFLRNVFARAGLSLREAEHLRLLSHRARYMKKK